MMFCLRVKAPFAAFRIFTAGFYRPTAPFITPSAAYGLILNLAGIESRLDDGKSVMTLMRTDLPSLDIALGAISFPEVQRIYQQLHNYPVGSTGKDRAPELKGAKYNIQPVWREFLSGLDAYICLRPNDEIKGLVRSGLTNGIATTVEGRPRYGIPFLGDNSFLIDVLREEQTPAPAFWYRRLAAEDKNTRIRRSRLTVWIDRADMTRTISFLYAATEKPQDRPPEDAWTRVGPHMGDRL